MVLEVVAGQGGSEESQRWPLGELTIAVNYRVTRHMYWYQYMYKINVTYHVQKEFHIN